VEAYSFPGLWTSMPCLMIGAQLSKAAAAPKVQLRIRLDWGIGMSEQIRDNPGYGLNPSNRLCSDLLLARLGWATRRPPRPSEASLELRYLGKVRLQFRIREDSKMVLRRLLPRWIDAAQTPS
jgi:hypothetical protein